ncbi:hypothetical protein [Thermoflexibacter ruber]|uniref:Outer membrane protein beta-barrel domain-containing protein n=1 Tax=Thermoflexibacter ruber TaxID=1003 RepID=A0A1I2GI13_9BACT|nr:hypothetical protein [Thermoflexibacter ruber]SFF17112.1 hypothetical protein SAMN04488541_101897 [Thermoflexibacter ruber]
MTSFLARVALIAMLFSLSCLSAIAQVSISTPPPHSQIINNQRVSKKAQKLLKAQQKANSLNNTANKATQKLSKLSYFGDSLQNLTLLSKRRRDSLHWKNLYFGGDFGLSVGGKQVFVNVSPLIGFKLSDKFSIGGGSVFQYLRTQVILIDPQGLNIKQTAQTLIYGGRGFTRLFLHKSFFAQADAELINVQLPTTDGNKIRHWVPGAWAGAGYNFDIGRGMGINLIISYNFLYKEGKSPYTSPLDVRLGIQF